MSHRIFFVVSGEHPSLPFAELNAIFESEQLPVTNLKVFPRVLSLQSHICSGSIIATRSSYVQQCCLELCHTSVIREEVLRAIAEIPLHTYLVEDESFAVRIQAFTSSSLKPSKLEAAIGHLILTRVSGTRVNLTRPMKIFHGVIVNSTFLFGIRIIEVSRKRFNARKPKNRPSRHPSTMSPKLARCLVNLARVTVNSLVLDPFCGTGAILLEAGAMGCRAVGCDINNVIIQGCRRNLMHFRFSPVELVVGDARSIAFNRVDSIVTDPPYGRAASRQGVPIESLVLDTFTNLDSSLSHNGYIAIAVPQGYPWREQICALGYSCVEAHSIREHKSLTREILIFNRG